METGAANEGLNSISTDASAVPISEININHENTQPALARHMAGVNQPAYDNDMSQGGEILENRTAAAALMQLHGHTRENLQSGDTCRFYDGYPTSTSALGMSNFYDRTNLYQSRSETGVRTVPYSQSGITVGPVHSGISQQTAQVAVQDTVANLSNTVTALQQQQAQITNALTSLTSMIQQGVHNGSQQQSSREQNSMNHISRYDHEATTNPDDRYNPGSQGQELFGMGLGQSREQGSRGFGRSCGLSRDFNESSQQQWTEDRSLPQSWADRQNSRRRQVSQSYSNPRVEVKLPPFNGKEEWKVWVSRFESVAKRHNWDDDTKLDNILPKLQGRAGEFVFNQLTEEEISCYPKLIKELNSRFHTIETEKTFAAKFSQRRQKHDETAEEYAAELKRLYSKAYRSRDSRTRQEDLVRKFLDGLKDQEARFEVEFHKEPENIDSALYHVVNFIQTRRRNFTDSYADRKFKKFARRASHESGSEDSDTEEEVGDCQYALRVPTKGDTYQKKPMPKYEQKSEPKTSQAESQGKAMTDLKDMVKALTDKVEELQKRSNMPEQQRNTPRTGNASGIICYACNNRGHIARNCPEKSRVQSTSNSESRQPVNQGKAGGNKGPLN